MKSNILRLDDLEYQDGNHWYYMDMQKHDKHIINKEQQKAKKQYERAMKKLVYFMIQKFLGLILIAISLIFTFSGVFIDIETGCNDLTFLLLIVPIGLYLLFTKKCCLYHL